MDELLTVTLQGEFGDCLQCEGKGFTVKGICPCPESKMKMDAIYHHVIQLLEIGKNQLPPEYQKVGFEMLPLVLRTYQNENQYSKLLQYARNEVHEGTWLFLSGDTGTGKTYSAVAIAIYRYLNHGVPVSFCNVPLLMNEYTKEIQQNNRMQSTECSDEEIPLRISLYRKMKELAENAELLVLDDVGREKGKQWAIDIVMEIIYERDMYCKTTMITSNLNLIEWSKRYDEPTMRRIADKVKSKEFALDFKKGMIH